MSVTVLVFVVANQRFGIPADAAREVVRAATLSPLPKGPRAVDGVLNLRGQLVPVVALRQLLGLPDKPLEHSDHFVIVKSKGNPIALRVDLAVDLLRLKVEDIDHEKYPFTDDVPAQSVAMTPEGVVFVLDVEQLLKQEAGQIALAMKARKGREVKS